jgi:hypothetical protein
MKELRLRLRVKAAFWKWSMRAAQGGQAAYGIPNLMDPFFYQVFGTCSSAAVQSW